MNTWVVTYTGKKVDLLNLKPEDVSLIEVAHALSQKCRFSGHTDQFYSVAQHSVLLSWKVDVQYAMYALLHDVGETYLPDIPTPIKSRITGFRAIEERNFETIVSVLAPDMKRSGLVRIADQRMCLTEARDLISNADITEWELYQEYKPYETTITPWDALSAEAFFLNRYKTLIELGGTDVPAFAHS